MTDLTHSDQGKSPDLKGSPSKESPFSFDYLTDDYGFFFVNKKVVNKKEIVRKKTPLQFIQLFENEHYDWSK